MTNPKIKVPMYLLIAKIINDIYKMFILLTPNNTTPFDQTEMVKLRVATSNSTEAYNKLVYRKNDVSNAIILFGYYWNRFSLCVAEEAFGEIKELFNEYRNDCKTANIDPYKLWVIGVSFKYNKFVLNDTLGINTIVAAHVKYKKEGIDCTLIHKNMGNELYLGLRLNSSREFLILEHNNIDAFKSVFKE